jgi:hypothetical protein
VRCKIYDARVLTFYRQWQETSFSDEEFKHAHLRVTLSKRKFGPKTPALHLCHLTRSKNRLPNATQEYFYETIILICNLFGSNIYFLTGKMITAENIPEAIYHARFPDSKT